MTRRDRNTTHHENGGEMCSNSLSKDEVLNSLLQDLCFWEEGGCQERSWPNNNNNAAVQSNSIHRNTTREERVSSMSAQHSNQSPRQSGSGEKKKVQSPKDVNEAHNWKTAVDPVSERTYYYNAVTRVTQWEKPAEVKAMEKKKKKEKRMRDVNFFREMEQNLKASLARGELIPTIPRADTEKEGPPLEPSLQMQALSRPTPARVRTISAMNEHLLLELRDDKNDSTRGADPPKNVVSRRSPTPGRPPLPQRRNSHSSAASSSSSKQKAEADTDPFELSPELPAQVYLTKHSSGDNDALQGEFLLDEPILNEGANLTLGSSLPSPDGDKATIARPAPVNSHKRVNTGGTIWLKSTMENPDIKATIQCVCGVYRAHIVQACKQQKQGSPNSSTTIHVDLDVFRDDYEYARGNINGSSKDLPIPSLADIDSFYQKFFQKAQMEHDTIIMSLIYVERLIKETNGYLTPRPDNWASILFSCMILASKVWDDLSMWNIDFSNVSLSPGMSPFSLKRINQLEIAVLTCLNFNVRVPASEYAKYYFLIRTMLTRSGLLEQATAPLNKEGAKRLENRTSNYQDEKLKGQRVRSRAKSFDWNLFGSKKMDTSAGPVLRENVCLEELLISMNR